ncbi:hypothetical protein JHK87_055353 [Glycine soja]|nr:hypothetical protein JHK87_055353 [Glycine soja]
MEAEAKNKYVKKEENNNDNNNNKSNSKIGNSSEGLSKPKCQMKTLFQLETLEKAYAAIEGQEGVAGKEAAKGSSVAEFFGGGVQVGA